MTILTELEQTKLKNFTINETIRLPEHGSWEETYHLLDKDSAYALEMALATGRPLLVRGEPGVGKSQLARAAAVKLGRLLVSEVVNITTEGQDLLWRYDPVARLNDAQAIRHIDCQDGNKENPIDDYLHPKNYINPGILWWIFDWLSANDQYIKNCRHKVYKPLANSDSSHEKGIVLLLDEIDKADPSLPNSLLEVLGNGGFQVPLLNQIVGIKKGQIKPLIIITTNEERELPPAFLRRCLVLNLKVNDDDLENWLIQRAQVHKEGDVSELSLLIMQKAATLLKKDREAAARQGLVKPGQAEYLDLLKALVELTSDIAQSEQEAKQLEWLENIKAFALDKAAQR